MYFIVQHWICLNSNHRSGHRWYLHPPEATLETCNPPSCKIAHLGSRWPQWRILGLSKASNCNSMWFPNTDQEFQMFFSFGGMRWTLDQRQTLFFRVQGFAEATLLSFILAKRLRFRHLSLASICCCLHVKLPSAALMADPQELS